MNDLGKHLKDAIGVNTERMPKYGQLTANQSIPFSKKLILFERIALTGAWYFDRVGNKLQLKGIPFLKEEFIEMSAISEFSTSFPRQIDYTQPLEQIELENYSAKLKDYLKKGNDYEIELICTKLLRTLANQRHVYCMLRHILESMRRIAFFIPIHAFECAKQDLNFPKKIALRLLWIHWYILTMAKKLDEAVSPIQNAGIPFLYQDLPKIDLEPRFYSTIKS